MVSKVYMDINSESTQVHPGRIPAHRAPALDWTGMVHMLARKTRKDRATSSRASSFLHSTAVAASPSFVYVFVLVGSPLCSEVPLAMAAALEHAEALVAQRRLAQEHAS